MVLDVFNQWSTAAPMVNKGSPAWTSEEDRLRIASYNLYEQIYANIPEAFSLTFRGNDENPIYIPAAKVIVETLHRYVAPGMRIIPDPAIGNKAAQARSMETLLPLMRRERFMSRFTANKRFGIIRGDWLFHIYADSEKPEGARISIFPLDPASYFPITAEDNVDEIIGVHIADTIVEEDGETYIYRLTYRKATEQGGPSDITVEEAVFEMDEWMGPDAKPKRVIRAQETLPKPIDQLPIYHIQNFQRPSSPWGTSEISGFERILTGVNQSISDEDLALALESLGVYTTDGGSPINKQTGQPEPWTIGPGRVIELADGKKFERVQGIGSVAPYQEHLSYLHEWIDRGSGTPAVAAGRVNVEVAESGIALMLELAPILSRAEERELVVTDVMTNLLYDLKNWLRAYERNDVGDVVWIPKYGDKVPTNNSKRFDEIMRMAGSGTPGGGPTAGNIPLVSAQWIRGELSKLGYEFPDDTIMMEQILQEREMIAQIDADIMGRRMDTELGGGLDGDAGTE